MAVIKETYVLEDRFSGPMAKAVSTCNKMADAVTGLRKDTSSMGAAATAAAKDVDRLGDQLTDAARAAEQASNSGDRLMGTLKGMLGAFSAIGAAKWLASTSDAMTGNAEAAAAAQNEIYAAAQRSRGAYTEMANLVSQLGMMAPEAFSDASGNLNTGELVAFAEQLQKQMTISGASGQSAAAAMVQLTQGLSSGTLRGEELNSVLEQTPMIAKTIAEYMGVSTGEMRELASEGAITADAVKNAILGAAEETNAAFASMPMTWAQVWTSMQNVALQALQPVLNAVSWLASNLDIVAPIVLGVAVAIGTLTVAINGAKIATAAMTAAQNMLNLVMTANPIGLVVAGIALLVGALYAGVAAFNKLSGSSVSATGIITGTFAAMGAMILNTSIIPMQNQFANFANFIGNLFNDPVAAVQVLFLDMATNILSMIATVASGIESLINAIPGMEVDITSGLEGVRDNVAAMSRQVKDASDWTEYVKGWDYIDPTEAYMSGYNWGANLNLGDSMGLGSLLGGSDTTGGYSPASIPGHDDIAGAIDGVGKDVKGIKKSVDLSKEDLKYMVDLTARRYVNNVNLTSQTPVITVNGQNTGNTEADREALARMLETVLLEQRAAGAAMTIAPRLAF